MAKFAIRSNRKFRRLVGMLRLDSPYHVKGHLDALWESMWDLETSLIGDFVDIESLAGWTDNADKEKYPTGAFAAALVMTGFVDTIVEGVLYAVHDWYEHSLPSVKRKIGSKIKADPTVCAETFWLGLDAWRQRAASAGIQISEDGSSSSGHLVDQTGGRSAIRSTNGAHQRDFVTPSGLVESGPVTSRPGRTSPPSSPPSSFSAGLQPGERTLADLRAAMSRVTDAVVHFMATGSEADRAIAEDLETQSLAARTLADWSALADRADAQLDQATRPEVYQ